MIQTDDPYLLFIEPKLPPVEAIEAIVDEYVDIMRDLLEQAYVPSSIRWYRGVHTCTGCTGIHSTPYNLILPHGFITNSLAVHYLIFHRKEVPSRDLGIINRLARGTTSYSKFKDSKAYSESYKGHNPRNAYVYRSI